MIVENEPPQNVFGAHPKGFLVLTREGRSIVVTTAENRRAGMGDAERAALHKSMLAYSGKYRIEGNDFITVVDVSCELGPMKAFRAEALAHNRFHPRRTQFEKDGRPARARRRDPDDRE